MEIYSADKEKEKTDEEMPRQTLTARGGKTQPLIFFPRTVIQMKT